MTILVILPAGGRFIARCEEYESLGPGRLRIDSIELELGIDYIVRELPSPVEETIEDYYLRHYIGEL